ncbi:GTP cyclohydrolase II-domain-containing protein [Gorgonomyces haynaldii]|nr:GTP cyclohydrolase II-domain-containing protein [Gorgonomyces haynaldii]
MGHVDSAEQQRKFFPCLLMPIVSSDQTMDNIIVECQVSTRISSKYGTYRLHLYTNNCDDKQHLALVFGDIKSRSLYQIRPQDNLESMLKRGCIGEYELTESEALVRIHSCCFTGDTLGSLRCDCGEQLHTSMEMIAKKGRGVVLYLMQEGRGIGLMDKLFAYNLIDMGHDTLSANIALGHPPDARSYHVAAAMLEDLGISQVHLLTNNPDKIEKIGRAGIKVVSRIPMVPQTWQSDHQEIQDRDGYLVTKIQRMGHILEIPEKLKTQSLREPSVNSSVDSLIQ